MNRPHRSWAVHDGLRGWTEDELAAETATCVDLLQRTRVRVLATLMDNSPAWIAADRACVEAGVVHVPLPAFFTPAQWQHALVSAGVDGLLAPDEVALRLAALGLPAEPAWHGRLAARSLQLLRLPARAAVLPPGTAKITFTSGTTGTPKGVCLATAALQAVAEGIADALDPLGIERHLCALPFTVLLENVAGLLAPASRGVGCLALPLSDLGLSGSSSFDPSRLDAAVRRHEADSLILLPQMLRAWAGWLQAQGLRAPTSLRFVAVGGAAVGARTLRAARALGLPAYEGYGLSEAGSVQTLNLPRADRPGSAGRALPHAGLRCRSDGEIEVSGSGFLGYIGDAHARTDTWWPTGDLGEIDADGYLHVRGRRRLVLITAYGRNVSPEWVETALRGEPAIAQAVVYGDGQPSLTAVVWPSRAELPDAVIDDAVATANGGLPDYARVARWVRARAGFDERDGLATPNGRPRREAIQQLHADALVAADADAG